MQRSLVPLVAAAAGALLGASPAPARPLDALAVFLGTWNSTAAFTDSAYSTAGSVTAVGSCRWGGTGRDFLFCTQDVSNGQHQASLFTYDPSAGAYKFIGTGLDGTPRTPRITVDGTTVTFLNTDQIGGKAVTFRTVNRFPSDGVEEFVTEYSLDGATWTTLLRGTAKRVAN